MNVLVAFLTAVVDFIFLVCLMALAAATVVIAAAVIGPVS